MNHTVIIFTSGVLVPCCQKFFYGVVCAEGDFDVSVFEYLRNGSCFSAYVCELSPLGFSSLCLFPFLVSNVRRFSAHILENKHSIGPMENIIEILHTTGKGRMMDTLERFYIFRETKISNQINDRPTIKPNIIFETIVQKDPHRGLPVAY